MDKNQLSLLLLVLAEAARTGKDVTGIILEIIKARQTTVLIPKESVDLTIVIKTIIGTLFASRPGTLIINPIRNIVGALIGIFRKPPTDLEAAKQTVRALELVKESEPSLFLLAYDLVKKKPVMVVVASVSVVTSIYYVINLIKQSENLNAMSKCRIAFELAMGAKRKESKPTNIIAPDIDNMFNRNAVMLQAKEFQELRDRKKFIDDFNFYMDWVESNPNVDPSLAPRRDDLI